MADAAVPIALLPTGPDFNYGATVPPNPSSPPTLDDITNAARFQHRVRFSFQKGDQNVDVASLAESEKYYFRVMSKAEPTPEPDWAARIENTIKESEKRLQDEIKSSTKGLEDKLKGEIKGLDNKLEETKKLVQGLEDRVAATQIFLYKSNNQDRSELGPFMQVPFPNGSMPWGSRVATPNGEVVLPRVETLNDVRNLTMDELYGYCKGYYPNTVPGGQGHKERRIQLILEAIGCMCFS